jgi:hypothetical protein
MITAYYPHQAAEIVRLCSAAGVPEQAADWLAEGYSVDEVARELRTAPARRGLPPAANQLPPAPAPAPPRPSAAEDMRRDLRLANEAFLQRR